MEPCKLTDFESQARRLRYQALGKACAKERIGSLLLGHHCDDNAETVLFRVYTKRLKSALKGMARSGRIPECEGIPGVDDSIVLRDGKTWVAEQGVTIYRPLLAFPKSRLRATSRALKLDRVEDPTNRDPTLTARNAIRYLLQGNQLPQALQTSRLLKLMAATRALATERHASALNAFRSLHLDVSRQHNVVNLAFSEGLPEAVPTRNRESRTRILRRALPARELRQALAVPAFPIERLRELLSGPAAIDFLEMLIRLILPHSRAETGVKANIARALLRAVDAEPPPQPAGADEADPGLILRHNGAGAMFSLYFDKNPDYGRQWTLTISRQPNYKVFTPECRWNVRSLGRGRIQWQLYDGRFWVAPTAWTLNVKDKISKITEADTRKAASQSKAVVLRPMLREDWSAIRKAMGEDPASRKTLQRLERQLKAEAPGQLKFSLPVFKLPDSEPGNGVLAMALPGTSLPWVADNLRWIVVPKHVGLESMEAYDD